MAGKILKISSNDLNGNVDVREVVVFSCFEHTKYMNNYVVFCFEGEYNKKKLCYGSVHLKKDSLVIFSVKDNIKKYIEDFVDEYICDKLQNYRILDIDNINKVELVSFNEMDYDKLEELDIKSIKRIRDNDKELKKEKKPIFLYVLLFMLIFFSIGITLLYFYPNLFTTKYKQLLCSNYLYDQELLLNYEITKDIKFYKKDKVSSINIEKVYIFLDSDKYYEFKNNKLYEQYFNGGEAYKFIDNNLSFKLMYQENSVIDDYNEMLIYLKREGFSCIEKEYEK